MSYTTPVANLTIDYPHANGRMTKWGFGRDWEADEPRQVPGGYTPDLEGPNGWYYQGLLEWIEPIRGIAPLGQHSGHTVDSNIADWFILSGLWQESSAAGLLRAKWLHFYDGRPNLILTGEHGRIASKANYPLNFVAWFWRFPAPPTEANTPHIMLHLIGDGSAPEYAIYLPAWGKTTEMPGQEGTDVMYQSPLLLGRPLDDPLWSIVDEIPGGSGALGDMAQEGARLEAIKVEYTDGWLIVNLNGLDRTWAYSGNWRDRNGREIAWGLTQGHLGIQVVGHPAMVYVEPLVYPASAILRPQKYLITGTRVNTAKSYSLVGNAPFGCTVTIVSEGAPAMTRPRITMNSGLGQRPIMYNVQEYRDAVIGATASAPVYSQGNPGFRLQRLSGSLSSEWRGASLEVEYVAEVGSSAVEVPMNSEVMADVSVDDGGSYIRQFAGYALPAGGQRDGAILQGAPQRRIYAADGIEARLPYHFMYAFCSLEAWPIDDAFEYILNRASVPASLIAVHPDINPANMGDGYYLPASGTPGERACKWRPDTLVAAALDDIVRLRQMLDGTPIRWGVDQTGVYFLAPVPLYTGAPVDFVIDQSSIVPEEIIVSAEGSQGVDGYANVILGLTGSGADAGAQMLIDADSIDTIGSDRFVGEDRWALAYQPDADDPWPLVEGMYWNRQARRYGISWEMDDRPDLMPDMFVECQVAGIGLPWGSIFQIGRKTWTLNTVQNLFTQRLEAVFVQ